ncbi:Resolvase domain protein [Desulfofarcimen acetoxidans DSM 771]|uniref:Resolvase domain protein n=1 Tax=Desulfofarcimen acetoxidans (strain ATCC 49208 / DSM 771 / KCTC 5769 / VKM B-1644 / 5575) TaxID=485916 RepID=C8W0J2_DESAS|nr:recombinase family protein [Desulfofarcimen acetoxidans]ACV63247.1 Resolvase domain protein [Desulfofarcimen acetoxidans DSM 771]
MKIGYCRVSTHEQDATRQILKMQELGIEERFIFVDKATGKNFDRLEYQTMKKIIREGDIIYFDALDRLGRNYDGIIKEWKHITRELEADIVVLENEALFISRKYREMGDIGKLMEDMFLALLSYVAEQEIKKRYQRQMEGQAVARAKGKQMGRSKCSVPQNFKEIYQDWMEGKITAVEAMRRTGMKKTSFYKMAKEEHRRSFIAEP